MAFLPAAFLLSLLLAAHGVYLQPPETSLGPNLFSSVSANSTCNGDSYTILTPLGATNTTGICNSFPAAAIDGALSSQWLSMPGDNAAEFTIGVSGLELSQVRMTFASPLPMMMMVETVTQSSGERNLLHVLVVDPASCASSPVGSVCTTFSNVTLSSDSETIVLEWPLSLGRTDDTSTEFLDLVSASSIIFTLSGFDPSLTDPMAQYFAVSEIAVRGRCSCNGHASRASVAENSCSCQCQHDTTGQHCEECAAGYQFSPWRRASPDCPFVCQSDACDVGGAIRDVMCTTTNCTCRNNVVGGTCDRPDIGFYVPSLQATSVEAETGMIVETGEMVVVDSDPANIPVFRGTGYVSYSLPVLTSQTIQWTLSIPVTSVYYMALTYHLPIREGENAFTANFILSRNSLMMSSQVPVSICPSPPCSTLSRTTFTLEQGTWTVGLHFPSRSVPTPEFYIDTVFAFPVTFVEANLLGNDSQMFIDTCNAQNNELMGTFCQQSAFSLSAHFYDGALPCNCDPDGSNGTICEPIGGQCPCYSPASSEDVASTDRQCSLCPRYFYGPTSSGCMPCGCVADDKLCDGNSGQCNCPMNVIGRTCDQCSDMSFGYNTTTGCQTCSCDPLGTAVCDNVTGDCQCRPLVSGSLCDSCDFGAYNLTTSGCVPCACDSNGSVGINCSSEGLCTCKPQVNGDKCSACVDGSFYFPPSPSSSGCLSCICSGVTTSCTAYTGEYTNMVVVGPPSVDLSGWTLARLNGESVEQLAVPPSIVQTNTSSLLMVSTLNVDPSMVGIVYWSFPQALITGNDWLLSYGGNIELTLTINGSLVLPEIILVAGNTMAAAQLFPAPSNTAQTYSVVLSESLWRSKLDGSVLQRDAFLQVLAQLDSILITALDNGTVSSTLSAAAYDSATSVGSSVLPIEQCSCPLEYTGLSCENCSPGYYRLNGTCVPCNCNNRSATCDEYTGVCLSCTDNTSGPNCERCADGYFNSNPDGEPLQCQLCPCDNTTATSSSCTALPDGTPLCTCNRGYTGPLCDQCDEGFHGNPPAVPCLSCECNGNIDPSVPGSCNASTGECLICTNNATGRQCEQCMEGFYGDATAQDCQMCNCAPIGSLSLICDGTNGQCPCRPGVNGSMCDMCEPGTWNLASGTGCEPCECNSMGSFSNSCDISTGQCSCKPGVTGRTCDACNVSSYGFSNEGCTDCGCGDGARNISCLQESGQCFCLPGVTGRACDMCQAYFENLTDSGCRDCGECVDRLVSIVTSVEALLQGLVSSVNTLVGLHQLDVVGLQNVSMRVDELLIELNNAETAMNALYSQYGMLLSTRDSLSARLGYLESTLANLQPRIQVLLDQSDVQLTGITAEETAMTGALVAAVELSDHLQRAQTELLAWQLEANEIHANITAVHSSVTAIDFGTNITSAEADAGFIETVLSTAQSADTMSQVQQGQAEDLYRRLSSLQEQNNIADSQQQLLATNLTELEAIAADVANISADITSVTASVNSSISVSVANSTVVSEVVASTSGLLEQIRLLLEQLAVALDLSVVTPDMVLNADSTPQPLPQAINDLQESIAGLLQLLMGVRTHVIAAEQHGADLSTAAMEVERILRPSLALGADALRVVTDYEQAVENINLALNISTAANDTATMAYQQAMQLIAQGHVQRAAQLLNTSQALLAELEALEQLASAAQQQADLANATSLTATVQVQALQAIANRLANLSTQLDATAASATLNVDTALQSVSDGAMCVSNVYTNVSSTSQMVLSNVARTMDTVAQLESVMLNTTVTAASARSLLSDANVALNERVALLDQITSEQRNTSDLSQTAFSELSDLRSRLEAVKQAAARISVAVRLDGNSSLGYNTPQEVVQSNYLVVSLFFRPEVFSGYLFSTPTLTGQPLSLFVMGGGVGLSYPTSMSDRMITSVVFPVGVNWYHLLATEDSSSGAGSSVRLTVAEIGGGRQWSTSEIISGPGLNYSTSSEVTIGGSGAGMNNYFTGCVDGVELNSVPLPLLTPTMPPGTCGRPCGPRPPVEADRLFENGTWFQGAGFVELLSAPIGDRLTLSLWFRTLLPEGLLFQGTGAANPNQFVAVYLSDGRLHLTSSLVGADAFTVNTTRQYNDRNWHYVTITVENQTGLIDVDNGAEMVTGSSTFAITMETRNLLATVYFGGLPPDANTSFVDVTTGFAGCMRGVALNGQSLFLSESTRSEQVHFGGCPAEVVSGVRFMGEGLAEFQPYTAPIVSVDFSFKTEQIAGILLEAYPLQVSIYHTHVRVSFDRVIVETAMPGYSNNRWHSVLVTASFSGLQLTVDGESWRRTEFLNVHLTEDAAILVGGTNRTGDRIASSFIGCIRNVVINNNNESLDFNSAVSLDSVALYGCRPAVPDVITSSPSVPVPSATPSSSIVSSSVVTSSTVVSETSSRALDPSVPEPVSTQPPVPSSPMIITSSEPPSPSPSPTSTLESTSISLPILSSFEISTSSASPVVTTDTSMSPSPSPIITTLPLPPPPPPLPPPSQSAVIPTMSTPAVTSFSSPVASPTPSPSTSSISTSIFTVPESAPPTQGTPAPSSAVPSTPTSVLPSSATPIESTPPFPTSVVTTDIPPAPEPTTPVPPITTVTSSPPPSETILPPVPTPTPLLALSGEYGSFMSFAVSEEDLKLGFNITLEFRTLSSEGIILFVGNSSISDFFALELKAGYLVYSFNLGAETAVLRSRQTYDDGQYHMVSLYRQMAVGSITVDGSDVVTGRPAGPYIGLDIAQEVLFLGGLPAGVPPRGILGPGETGRPSVIACFTALSINTKPLDLSAPMDSQGITDCPPFVTNEATFRGNGFVQFNDTFFPGVTFSVSLWFRTTVCNGILFYLANLDPSVNDYTSLELIAGDLRFTFDNGGGAVALEYLPINSTILCSGQWVSVMVTKNGISGEMSVNREIVAMESSELVNLMAVNEAHPLYLGGVPNVVRSSQMVETPDFVGCMRDVVFSSDGSTTKPNFIQSSRLVNATAGVCQMDVAGTMPL